MNKFEFSGTGVALITPFKADHSVDLAALENVVEHVIAGGADYLVALGTTSEAPVLDEVEKFKVRETIIRTTASRVPVVLGVGGNNTSAVVKQLEHDPMDGFSGILSVTPYYNKPGQEGLYAHFDAVAKASRLPVILYNVPGRTAVNMKASTTLELAAKHKNIVAVKEASGDMLQIMNIIRQKPDHFEVISGDDGITLPLMAAGAVGVISVAANAFTVDFSAMVSAMLNERYAEARALHYKMFILFGQLFAEGSPAGVKALMSYMNLCGNVVRLPLTSVSPGLAKQIENQWTLFYH
ncbi:MAG TPA: 4-hydroxy-tetrahydrodipicolinate synthase [Bacteroidales bacterium]|nr:4-hydroxy-tetrahydrodipicolinate synthase [Bacteroidales bacterium]